MIDLLTFILMLIALAVYLLPTIIAFNRKPKHPHRGTIFLCNLLFGLTGVVWLIVLVVSLTNTDPNKNGDLLDRTINGALDNEEIKTCPFCAEKIKAAAKVCRFCNSDLSSKPIAEQSSNSQQTDSISSYICTLREHVFKAILEEDNDRAIGICNKILKSHPANAKTLSIRSIAYSSAGEYDKAQADIGKAIRSDPDEPDAYESQALLYYMREKGDLDKAMWNINKAIRINPDDGEYYWVRGRIFFYRDDFEKAITDFTKVFESDVADLVKGQSYSYRGTAFLRAGELERAKSDLDNALEINPNDGDAQFSRAVVCLKLKEYDRGQHLLNRIIETDPKNITALEMRANIYAILGEKDKAKEDLSKAISLNPENIDELMKTRAELDDTATA